MIIKALKKASLATLFFLFLFTLPNLSKASGDSREFNAGEIILHHILDAHQIHFFTLNEGKDNEFHFSLPLPVILYTPGKGFDFFMSDKFGDKSADHNHSDLTAEELNDESHLDSVNNHSDDSHHYLTYGEYAIAHEHIYLLENGMLRYNAEGKITNAQPLDFSITKTVVGVFIVLILLIYIFLKVAKSYSVRKNEAPKGLQSFMEPLILFIRDEVAKPSIGKDYARFMPYLLTVFFFILFCNLLGLIPFLGGFNITGNISVTMVLAVITFFITNGSGKKDYYMHILWPPGIPTVLKFLLIPIEIMGVFIKPIVLMLRLFANITAGHIIILSFISLIFIFGSIFGAGVGYGVSLLSLAFGIFMNIMEFLVAFLQAYVFTLLSALYFGGAVEEHHHEHAHAEHH
jgi:F-type H+-transporting ATPase subunit a